MQTSSSNPRLDPDGRLAHALDALRDQGVPGAERAAAALARLLAGHGDGARDWARSPLTRDGFPCELTFGSGAACVRYAVEPAAASARTRLGECESLLAAAGVPALRAVVRNRIDALQAGGALAYGAWIGAAHDGARDRYKLYAEVPEHGADAAALAMLTDYLGHAGPHLRYPLRMLGCDPAAGTLEFYFRCEGGLPTDLFQPARQQGDDEGLPRWMAACARRLPAGFSLALDARGRLVATSRYVFANRALGADARVRGRVLRHAVRQGWDLSAYAAASAPALDLASRHARQHGLLAWITPLDGPSEFRLGLTPPRRPARLYRGPSA